MRELDLCDNDLVGYRVFIDKFRNNLANQKKHLKFAFTLFDEDNNGTICLKDLQGVMLHFGGLCDATIMQDYKDMQGAISAKNL